MLQIPLMITMEWQWRKLSIPPFSKIFIRTFFIISYRISDSKYYYKFPSFSGTPTVWTSRSIIYLNSENEISISQATSGNGNYSAVMSLHLLFEEYNHTLFWVPISINFNGTPNSLVKWCITIKQDATDFTVTSTLYDTNHVILFIQIHCYFSDFLFLFPYKKYLWYIFHDV